MNSESEKLFAQLEGQQVGAPGEFGTIEQDVLTFSSRGWELEGCQRLTLRDVGQRYVNICQKPKIMSKP